MPSPYFCVCRKLHTPQKSMVEIHEKYTHACEMLREKGYFNMRIILYQYHRRSSLNHMRR